MAYEPKEMTGSLFPNDKREKDTHPNTRGSALIDGVAYFVDGWTKQTGEGVKWLSLSFKRKDKQPEGAKPRGGPDLVADDPDDLPF